MGYHAIHQSVRTVHMNDVKKQYSVEAIKEIGKMTGDGICLYDLINRKFSYFNNGFIKIFETSKEEIAADSFRIIERLVKHDRDYVDKHLTVIRNKGKIQNIEFRLKFESTEKYVSVDAFLLNDSNLLLAMIKEVSTAKQHLNYVVEFGARKDALLDMVAHNLSGPLNLTTNLLNVIDQMNKSHQYKKIDNHSRLIRESTHQCIEIINSFLKEEHSESQRVLVKNNLFDVYSKVKIVVERMRDFNKDKQIRIISKTKELMVSADDVKFFQIVHNLLSNAVKFTPSKGKITVAINDYEHFFEVSVHDTGIGIPEHLQPYVFQRNTPASREGLKGEKSIGMGLYIVKKLAEMMHGKISFKSEENVGSTFLLRLPKE